jgi:hypothetical protein
MPIALFLVTALQGVYCTKQLAKLALL